MANVNYVVLAGNLTRDPEVRYTPSGTAVGDLNMAINRSYRTADGENREETCFVNVVVWGRQAETSGQYLSKGAPVLVEGRLQYDQWEKDGQKQSRLRVRAVRVQFLSGPRSAEFRDGGGRGEAGGQETAPPPAAEPERQPDERRRDDGAEDEDNLPF